MIVKPFCAALCGKDAAKPLYDYQSPQLLTLFDPKTQSMESVAQAFMATHRGFFIIRLSITAAMDFVASTILYPQMPVTLDMFLFWDGIPYEIKPEFLTLDYCGA